MKYEAERPKRMPEPGYYYHYKHDPAGPVNNYAYYIHGVGHHTEEDCRRGDHLMLVYQPFYEAFVYKHGKMFWLRSLHMFYEPANVGEKEVPRFTKITDEAVIAKLREIKHRMYPPED